MTTFRIGQLVKRRKVFSWPNTHFSAVLVGGDTNDNWFEDESGIMGFAGRVDIAYEEVGMCVILPDKNHYAMTVLFGENIVLQNIRDMEPYEV